jgi:hypothetical protein
VIPADRKWFGRIGAAAVITHALTELDPRYPKVSREARQELLQVKQTLEAQAPEGAAPDPFTKERRDEGSARADRDGAATAGEEAVLGASALPSPQAES